MIQLIQAATQPKSKEEQINAEKALIEQRQLNTNQFFRNIIDAFKDVNVPSQIRQAAGTIIAVSVIAKGGNGSYIWDNLDGQFKVNIRNAILQVLIDADRNVRRTAANIVSAICFLQLPRNAWEGIVQNICVNISHTDEIVKESSILTLGFICSRMKERPDFSFGVDAQENILGGIIMGIQQSNQLLRETSLKALRDSIASLTNVIEKGEVREFILKTIADILSSGNFVVEALQILGQFVKSAFNFIAPYIAPLYQILEPVLSNPKKEDECMTAMEVWENIAAENKEADENCPKIITGEIGMKVVTLLLQNLCAMESEELQGNTISDSASKTLETIFDNGSQQYKELVLKFVSDSMAMNNWRYRQASIKAFALVLLGLSQEENEGLIQSSIHQLMGLLQDTSIAVQYATLESLGIIAEVCGNIILQHQHFVEYLQLIFAKISMSEPFLKSGCKIIDFLCEADKDYGLGKFTNLADNLIQALLEISLNPNVSRSMISWAVSTMMSVIEVAHNAEVSYKYINFVIDNFENIGKIGDVEKRETLASAFFTIIQYCLHGLKGKNVEMEKLTTIYNLVINYFKAKSEVTSDGIYAIEALCSFFPNDNRLLEDFWQYIEHALSRSQDPMLFRATIICISAFTLYFSQGMGTKAETFVPLLINFIKLPTFNRDLKLDCLICLGEYCLNCPQSCLKFLPEIVEVIMASCNAAIGISDTDFAYSEALKDAIVECLMCITHALNFEGSKIGNQLNPYVLEFFRFLFLTLDKKYKPTVEYYNRSLLLMTDIRRLYGAIIAPKLLDLNLPQLINTFKTFNRNDQYTKNIRYIEANLK